MTELHSLARYLEEPVEYRKAKKTAKQNLAREDNGIVSTSRML